MKKSISGALTAPFLATPFLATMLLSLAATPASAQFLTSTDYPGTMCHVTNGADLDIKADGFGRIFNTSFDGGRVLVCPIPHSEVTPVIEVKVDVLDRSLSTNVACTVFFAGVNGSVLNQTATISSAGVSPNEQGLFITIPSAFGNGSRLLLGCSLPPANSNFAFSTNSGIVGYTAIQDLTPLRKLIRQ